MLEYLLTFRKENNMFRACILVCTSDGKIYVGFFSPVKHINKYKCVAVTTDPFQSIEEMKEWIDMVPSLTDFTQHKFDWDGEGIPQMIVHM